jgi:hypothetical protein
LARKIERKFGKREFWLDGYDFIKDGREDEQEREAIGVAKILQAHQLNSGNFFALDDYGNIFLHLLRTVQLAKKKGGETKINEAQMLKILNGLLEIM